MRLGLSFTLINDRERWWKRWRKTRHILSFPSAFSRVLVWTIGENHKKYAISYENALVWKQTENASVGEIFCFVFVETETDTVATMIHLIRFIFFYEKRITEISWHGIVPAQTGGYVCTQINKWSRTRVCSARGFHGMIFPCQLIVSFLHVFFFKWRVFGERKL